MVQASLLIEDSILTRFPLRERAVATKDGHPKVILAWCILTPKHSDFAATLGSRQKLGLQSRKGLQSYCFLQGVTLLFLSFVAYDTWCGVAHGCTKKIGLKICGK